jgi:hypothetical protein
VLQVFGANVQPRHLLRQGERFPNRRPQRSHHAHDQSVLRGRGIVTLPALCCRTLCCLKTHRLTRVSISCACMRAAVQEQWLQQEDNVIAVHCKAGKGRTGMMICCWLIHSQACSTSRQAIELFGKERTKDRKVRRACAWEHTRHVVLTSVHTLPPTRALLYPASVGIFGTTSFSCSTSWTHETFHHRVRYDSLVEAGEEEVHHMLTQNPPQIPVLFLTEVRTNSIPTYDKSGASTCCAVLCCAVLCCAVLTIPFPYRHADSAQRSLGQRALCRFCT